MAGILMSSLGRSTGEQGRKGVKRDKNTHLIEKEFLLGEKNPKGTNGRKRKMPNPSGRDRLQRE